ncbi:MAG TPA: GAF domain-containing SpoIIE family protein phosphatase [Thermoanaerobaculia bacterium]|nr:GAF domain-containing SpoIIE family protein phosphatase [Thermoanaerobaculia bacterium]
MEQLEATPNVAPNVDEEAGDSRCLYLPGDMTSCLLAAIQELNSASDLRSGLAGMAGLLHNVLQHDYFCVLLLDELGRELRYELAAGVPPEVAEHWRFGMGQGLVGTVAKTGRAVRVGDVQEDKRYIRAVDRTRSELVVPLATKNRTIGVLDIGSFEPHHFTDEHETLMVSLAGFLASAIETAQLYQNLREQARTLSLLHEVSREVSSILDRRRLLERVAELVRRLIEYDIFSVMLWNEEQQLLEPWISFQRDGRVVSGLRPTTLGVGLSGTAAALRQSLRVPNVHLDPRYLACQDGIDIRSELVVPLVFEDRLLGVIDLESKEYDAFTSRHEQLLSTLAASLAIALENARLYEQVRQDEQRLKDDVTMAQRIQQALLPRATPWLSGFQIGVAYEPARDLGGDFYDFLPYGEGRLAVAVGDVAGKALPAALYGSFAIGLLREYAAHGEFRPAQVLEDLNCKLLHVRVDRRFLAMIFAVVDSADRSLTLASSGLPYPYLVRGGQVEPVLMAGLPLGLLPERTYDEVRLEVQPGDVVVICSDGIEESRNGSEEDFGGDRVREVLRGLASGTAYEIADGLLDACRRYSGRSGAADDRTVVVIKVA